MLRNIALTISYDGTSYSGWQIQPDRPSVQEHIEESINSITQEKCSLTSASRTDAGVHAVCQVANFRTNSTIPCWNLRAALQTKLPADIVITSVQDVKHEFHATYAAIEKKYRYLIWNSSRPHAFLRRYAWHFLKPLNTEIMQESAHKLLGKHDFRSFETEYPNKATSIRTVKELNVKKISLHEIWETQLPFKRAGQQIGADSYQTKVAYLAHTEDQLISIDIVADGFLYNMVRAIVGTLKEVGIGRWDSMKVQDILESQDRSQAGQTAPAQGLLLQEVKYAPESWLQTE